MISYDKSKEIISRLIEIKGEAPVSTYRLQMNSDFNFTDAISLLDYLYDLGISHIYSSPLQKAAPGSNHGYDVIDHTRINEEIGTQDSFLMYTDKLKERNMGLILDIVPNHMCTHYENPIFKDILTHGQASRFMEFMDINWDPVKKELKNRILLPLLGSNFGEELEKGNLELVYREGYFLLLYYDNTFPIDPMSYGYILSYSPTTERFLIDDTAKDLIELEHLIYSFNALPSREYGDPIKRFHRYSRSEVLISKLHELYMYSPLIRSHIQNSLTLINGKKGDPSSFDRLEEVINMQAYRLANWKVAAEEINYRRFFDINSLAAVSMEIKEVFDYTHNLIFNMLAKDRIQGLRIDHPDGLYNPDEYYINLQIGYLKHKFLKEAGIDKYSAYYYKSLEIFDEIICEIDPKRLNNLYIVIEKILSEDEQTPRNWSISGTVGYENLNLLNHIFVKKPNHKRFIKIYTDFIGEKIKYENLVFKKKHMIMKSKMWSEVRELANKLNIISEMDRHTRDFTLRQLQLAIEFVVASFPVYRTYIESEDENLKKRDIQYIKDSVTKAKHRNSEISPQIFDFIQEVLLGKFSDDLSVKARRLREEFVLRFQQLTSPIMAKGLEDTAFYIYNKLVSLNEVGGHPNKFGIDPVEFHNRVKSYMNNLPYSLITTSTHDNKRSEDVRARINVLSEIPNLWQDLVMKFSKDNEKYKTSIITEPDDEEQLMPDKNTEYLIYQTLIGSYPIAEMNDEMEKEYFCRIWGYLQKAIREAKTYTNWINPNMKYENACKTFLEAILKPKSDFLKEFIPFQSKVSRYGCYNSLSQLIIKLGIPGISDFYQGNEIWNYSLVDPDNRRKVDYDIRRGYLKEVKEAEKDIEQLNQKVKEWFDDYQSGKIKLYITYKGLNLRKAYPDLFLSRSYYPIEVYGDFKNNIVSFARSYYNRNAIFITSRFFTEISDKEDGETFLGLKWNETRIEIPEDIKSDHFIDILTGTSIQVKKEKKSRFIYLKDLFTTLPFSIMLSDNPSK
jgi:(1->4)-alpha-D-glucan 1-alpha-D-glucosylmutase